MLTTHLKIGRSFTLLTVPAAAAAILTMSACTGSRLPAPVSPDVGVSIAANAWLEEARDSELPFRLPLGTRVDTIRFSTDRVEIEFSRELARTPFRPVSVAQFEAAVRQGVGTYLAGRDLELYSMGVPVRELIPNVYRDADAAVDSSRLARHGSRPAALVTNIDRAVVPTRGLAGRYVAMWHSHGWYYNHAADRWMWQRPRVFQTVEDL
ncbi:MAG: hypothetical protein HKN13_14650, partial [Rhodothermales bacterium]|nr:hypothetical protein [Rhodothermales bacterium]